MTTATLSGSISDLISDDSYSTAFKNLRLRIYRSDGMIPTSSSSVSIAGYYDVETDLVGAFSVAGLIATDADTGIPAYRVEATVLPSAGGPAEVHATAWFPLTENRTLAWVVEHYYPPSGVVWTPGLIQQAVDAAEAAEAAAAAAIAVGSTNDTIIASRLTDTTSASYDASGLESAAQARMHATATVLDPTVAAGGTVTNLTTPTYDGSGVAVHPSIVFDPDGWNGWRYWMVMTPYPSADNTKENPSLLVSQDGTTWQVPAGVTNPLIAWPGTGDYNSDPNLLFGPDGRLHLFFRAYISSAGAATAERIRHMSSADGVTWTTPVTIITNDQTVRRIMAPTVVYEPSARRWVMYGVDILPSPRKLVRMTATSPEGTWSAPVNCTITGNAGDIWHTDVHKVGGQWQMLVQDTGSGGGDLWAATSVDGLAWTAGPTLIGRSTGAWATYYKSCFLPVDRGGSLEWDAWLGAGIFGASGPSIRRTIVRFPSTAEVALTAATAALTSLTDSLAAARTMPPWLAGDTFARADSGSLGTAESGQSWTGTAGTYTISGKAAVPSAAANTRSHVEVSTAAHHARLQVVPALNAQQSWVICGLVDGNNYYRFGISAASGSQFALQRIAGGSATAVATYNPPATTLAATGQTVGISISAGVLTGYINGAAVATYTDGSPLGGTKAGLQASSTSSQARNFVVRTP